MTLFLANMNFEQSLSSCMSTCELKKGSLKQVHVYEQIIDCLEYYVMSFTHNISAKL